MTEIPGNSDPDAHPGRPSGHEPRPGVTPSDELPKHPPYHCYFTEEFANACHQPTLHITGIIHDRDLMPALSTAIQEEGLGGLADFYHTTFVYGDRTDGSVSNANLTTRYLRSRKESNVAIARPRLLTARELLDREVNRPHGNRLLEVYLDTKRFRKPSEHPLNAEGAKLLILHGLVRSMMGMPRPMPPAENSPRWLATVLSKRERLRRLDPHLDKKEELVSQFVGLFGNAIRLELGPNPHNIEPTPEPPAELQAKWELYYAGRGPKPIEEHARYLAGLAERTTKDEDPEQPET